MAPKVSKADKKIAYDSKICQLLDEYTQVLVAAADNVGSNQLQSIRRGLRGDSMVLMGKNTMMKRSIRIHAEKTGNSAILNLITLLVGNVGLIFTKGDLKEVSEEVAKYKASVSVVRAIGDQWIVQWIGETILQYFNGSVVAKGEDRRWTDLYNYRNKQHILTHRELVLLVCIGESLLASLAWQGLTNFVRQIL